MYCHASDRVRCFRFRDARGLKSAYQPQLRAMITTTLLYGASSEGWRLWTPWSATRGRRAREGDSVRMAHLLG